MLVDISGMLMPTLFSIFMIILAGFTALTERMGQQGAEGTEQMTKHVNSYFAKLISKIYDHSGDILKFAVRSCAHVRNSRLTFNLKGRCLVVYVWRFLKQRETCSSHFAGGTVCA
jgi:hypothetical protein